ncbi:lysylphosphatidylglycerol synthase domain-containing protein [Chelativorans sp. M5D2P16]|uniref:lysylphosphatidylglycerol synthase domain-containing protein n=1 Tax=Chelativorans sp. M5D2P16 TaxID=3095678 RepID=UPI002ACA576E|nr:lysylphosphatidylglycerol synthase domain-containing protein [Chelativorans sp. M5D2P16]MDZ5695951.1 lysylphosphatidylglycerol synthase domain-containing protein [Chelativorans sp. M5D2P16]
MTSHSGAAAHPAKHAGPFRRYLGYTVAVAAVALAAFLLYRTLSQYDWPELVSAVTAVSLYHMLLAIGFTAASYLTLTGFDFLALKYAGHPLAYRRAALASFCSLSIGHNIGLAALSSGAIRYRFYSRWGLGAGEVAKVIVFCGVTVGLGLSILGGVGLLVHPDLAIDVMGIPSSLVTLVAVICLLWPALYLVLAATVERPLRFRGMTLAMPGFKLALGQVILGTVNFAFVAGALHQTIAALADVPYLEVAAVYVSANVATLITHVPGGLGVIESVVLYLLPRAELIGAVLVFRFVYFLLPLALGSLLLGFSEVVLWGRGRRR